ncbi:hypothetical protein H2201_007489 [Coniosporium apollinis]|uniref:Uncharacterized protein n=2 Tax=Coniosporium TaxID=2810619 RepID=A0ABQ9NJI8_9PEZI|nr:hypothetical protein H2199_002735 [Cladosporium sp. JES 115]KAJ9659087.1 hypothetical protein H2201_007489 [Coniosporium apollinis]
MPGFVYRENRVPYYQRLYQKHDGKRLWWKVRPQFDPTSSAYRADFELRPPILRYSDSLGHLPNAQAEALE